MYPRIILCFVLIEYQPSFPVPRLISFTALEYYSTDLLILFQKMSEKRFPSSALVEAIEESVSTRKARMEANRKAAKIRQVRRLQEAAVSANIEVQNLRWERKRLEQETIQLKVERAREEGRKEGRKIHTYVLSSACEHPSTSAVCPLQLSSVQTVRPDSTYVPTPVKTAVAEDEPLTLPIYTPTILTTTENARNNPVMSFTDRSPRYWRKLIREIGIKNFVGKTLMKHPEDNLIYQVLSKRGGVILVNLGYGTKNKNNWFNLSNACKV